MKKKDFPPESETQNMINCEHVIVQRVVSQFFHSYILSKQHAMHAKAMTFHFAGTRSNEWLNIKI